MTEIIAQVPWQVTPKVSNPRTAIELLIILPEGRRGFFRDQMALYSALKRSGRPRLAPPRNILVIFRRMERDLPLP